MSSITRSALIAAPARLSVTQWLFLPLNKPFKQAVTSAPEDIFSLFFKPDFDSRFHVPIIKRLALCARKYNAFLFADNSLEKEKQRFYTKGANELKEVSDGLQNF